VAENGTTCLVGGKTRRHATRSAPHFYTLTDFTIQYGRDCGLVCLQEGCGWVCNEYVPALPSVVNESPDQSGKTSTQRAADKHQ
ncbi:MAG: hypothetical protein KC561_13625, partial [Myxococcales bacterium]|nr:hypothetical protein [Myxococcales bacterium]